MPAVVYRLFLSNKAATQAQLDSVEEITVDQEVDMAWEARLRIPLNVDDKGNWQGEGEAFMKPFARIRVEIKVGDSEFAPLIDGPVVGNDSIRSTQPGQSFVNLIVQDDSVYLNRNEEIESLENMSDDEIAEQLFNSVSQIADTDIDETPPPPPDSVPPNTMRRGTAMNMLRQLARAQGMHAYVLPGDEPGASVGCFKLFTTESSDLPPLILLGKDKNVEDVTITSDAQSPALVQAFSLNVSDRSVASPTSSFRNVELLGEEQSFEDEANAATQLALPGPGGRVDTTRRVDAATEQSSFSLEASGSVLSDCYCGVLRPYEVVSIRAINSTLSGNYLLHRVSHSLTRSQYTQNFVAKRNARSSGSGGGLDSLIGSIF